MYTKICKEEVDRGQGKAGRFFHTLIQKVQTTFEGNSAFDENIKEITLKLEDETDEKKKSDLEERLEMLKNKEKRYILGNIKWVLLNIYRCLLAFKIVYVWLILPSIFVP
jgi:hypothetical protein